MLVIVFKNGREHRIKGCKSYSMPTIHNFFGEIKMENGQTGVIYDKDEISFCYFTKDDLELSNNKDLETYKKALELACGVFSQMHKNDIEGLGIGDIASYCNEYLSKKSNDISEFMNYFKTKATKIMGN